MLLSALYVRSRDDNLKEHEYFPRKLSSPVGLEMLGFIQFVLSSLINSKKFG